MGVIHAKEFIQTSVSRGDIKYFTILVAHSEGEMS
jgi:hypothetical protein